MLKGKTGWNLFQELKVVLFYSIKTVVSHLQMVCVKCLNAFLIRL